MRAVTFLMVLLTLLICAPPAFAGDLFTPEELQAVVKPGGENAGPAAGTLAAAALESAGYRAQMIVLRDLKNLLTSGAGLIFLICGMVGLASVALFGKYDMVLWMLIGPVLFAFVLTTTKGSGAQWQWGNDPELKAQIERVTSTEVTQPSDVSQLFHWYNNLISSIYRSLISVISDKEHTKLMRTLMSRQRIVDELYRDELKDGRLRGLISYTHEQCSTYFDAARIVALSVRDKSILSTPAYAQARLTLNLDKAPGYTDPSISSVSSVLNTKRAITDAATLHTLKELSQVHAPKAYERRVAGEYKAESDAVPAYMSCLNSSLGPDHRAKPDILDKGASCNDLICWMWIGVDSAAYETLNGQKQGLFLDKDPELWKQIQQDIVMKLTVPEEVEMASDAEGATYLEPGDPNYRLPEKQKYERYKTDISAIPIIVGGNLLKKALANDSRSQVLSSYANHAGVVLKTPTVSRYMTPEQEQDLVTQMRQHQMATAKQWEIYTFAMTLPYLQGVLLYMLSLTFPFFALFLLVPGHANTVFKWMTMWAWAKSWDVGWVFVATIDDILWGLLPNSAVVDPVGDPKHAPVQMLEIAFQGDPSYSLATYYMLVSLMIVGVPVITAQIIMGGKNAVADLIVGGAKELSQKIGGYANDWVRHDYAIKTDTLREAAVRKHTTPSLAKEAAVHLDELKQSLATQEGRESTADFRKRSAERYAAGGAVAMAFGALVVNRNAGIGIALFGGGLGALNASQKNWKDYLTTKRRISKNQTELIRLNASAYNSLARRNEEVLRWDSLRAGATLRGEFANLPPEETMAIKGAIDFTCREKAQDISEWYRTQTLGPSQIIQGAITVPAASLRIP